MRAATAGVHLHVHASVDWSGRTIRSRWRASPTSTTTRPFRSRSSWDPEAPSTTSPSSTGRTSGPPWMRGTSTPGSGTASTAGRSSRSASSTATRRRARSAASGRSRCLMASTASAGGTGRRPESGSGRRSGAPVSPASATPYPSYPFLHLGSKGDFVAWAQQLLAGGGYGVPINGYFQAPTQAAVFAFQADHGLPQTGNLDVPTWGPLLQNKPLAVRWTKGRAAPARRPGIAPAAVGGCQPSATRSRRRGAAGRLAGSPSDRSSRPARGLSRPRYSGLPAGSLGASRASTGRPRTLSTVGTTATPYLRARSGRSLTSSFSSGSDSASPRRRSQSWHSEQSGWVNST